MKKIDFDEILALDQCLSKDERILNNPIILYGAGVGGDYCLKYLQNYNVKPVAICDTFKAGQDLYGYRICNIEDVLNKYENAKVIITSIRFYEEIKNNLLEFFPAEALIPFVSETTYENLNKYREFIRCNKSELNEIYNIFNDEKSRETFTDVIKGRVTANNEWALKAFESDQYFANNVVTLNENESFVDGGAYVGDTAEIFIEKTNNNFDKIYCFEPSEFNYSKLEETKAKYKDDQRLILYKAGLYSDNMRLGFDENSISAGNAINENSDLNSINVVSIDNVIVDKVTFIKMDIEGAELEALKGARETITKYRPKLAICVYHKNEDIIDIPKYIMSLGLDYKYYLRHHNPYDFYETVFYAI